MRKTTYYKKTTKLIETISPSMDIDMVSFTPHQGQGFYCVSPMEKVFVLRTSADYSYTLFTLINRLKTHFGICVVWLNI